MFEEFFRDDETSNTIHHTVNALEIIENSRLLIRKLRANLLHVKGVQVLRSQLLEIDFMLGDASAEGHRVMLDAMASRKGYNDDE